MSRFIRIRGIHEVAGQNLVFDPQFLKEGVRAIPPDIHLGESAREGTLVPPWRTCRSERSERWRFSAREAGFRGEGVERERE
jgi:hypothetical protein